MKKTLIHSLTFPPDTISTGMIVSEIADGINNEHHNIEVLASSPQYNLKSADSFIQDNKYPMRQPFVSWDNSHLFLMNDLWNDYNYQKNCLLVENYCAANSIVLHTTTVTEIDHRDYPSARDRQHPGPEWHMNVAALLS